MYKKKENIDANEYLDQYYPRNGFCLIGVNRGKRRRKIIDLNISNIRIEKTLTGTLDLSDFTNLEHLTCFGNQISQIILPNRCKLERLDCSHNQLTILDLASCFQLKWLCCNYNELKILYLNNSYQLKELYCSYNKLNELILPNDNSLIRINVNNNYLTSFDYHKLNSKTLYYLNLSNNNFKATNISVFRHLENIDSLIIWNDYFFQKSNFYGSFEAFKKCTKLKTLNIYNSKIKRGFEYLPDSTIYIPFNSLIKNVGKLKNWKEDHPQLVKNAKIITELSDYEEVNDLIKEAFSKIIKRPNHLWWKVEKNQLTFWMLCDENSPFRFHWFDRRYIIVEKLRVENEDYYKEIERVKSDNEFIHFFIFFTTIITGISIFIFKLRRREFKEKKFDLWI